MYIIKERIGHNLQQKFDFFNKEFFDNELSPVPVYFTNKVPKEAAGICWIKRNPLEVSIGIKPELEQESEVMLDSILIHEMIHYWIEVQGLQNNQYHNKAFKAKVDLINKQSHNKYRVGYTEVSALIDDEDMESKKIYALFCLYDKSIGKDNLATPIQLFDEDRYIRPYIYECLRNMNVEARVANGRIKAIYVCEVEINNNFITEKSIVNRLNQIYLNETFPDTFDYHFLKLMKQSKKYKIVNSFDFNKKSFVPSL